jgi:hypothetical protein
MSRQAADLDDSVMTGINAVRRSSENITLQTMKAIEGLSQQSAVLQDVSEGLFRRIEGVTNRFDAQGQQILQAADLLEHTNARIDTTLQSRHADLSRTLDKLSGKADEFGRTIADYSTGIEGSISTIEAKARALTSELRDGAEARSRALISELERVKTQTEAESDRALNDLRSRFESVSGDLTREFGSLTSRLESASDETRKRAAEAAAQLAREQARIREEAARLPGSTRETADAMRRALQDQMRALEQLSKLTARTAGGRDITLPEPLATSPPQRLSLPAGSSTAAPAAGAPASGAAPTARAAARSDRPGRGGSGGDGWSLGDLLARASNEDRSQNAAPAAAPEPFRLDVSLIARAIDSATASNIWNRVRSGQQGVMVRSIYSPDARAVFDAIVERLPSDPDLMNTIARYLVDFERIIKDADDRDPTGRLAHTNLISETGRVYLFLAHAAGRLA